MRRAGILLLVLYAAALGQLAWYVPRMPAVMATHYDGAGVPNGSMTRTFALGFHLAMLGITAAAFGGLPVLLSRISPALINIPNREHWLAPERRKATVDALRARMAALGCGAVVLLMVVSELNFRANLNPPARLAAGAVVACVAGFALFVAGWIVALYRRFPNPAGA